MVKEPLLVPLQSKGGQNISKRAVRRRQDSKEDRPSVNVEEQ